MQDVAASGVVRPHDYEPGAQRMATERDAIDVDGFPAVGAVGTTQAAVIYVAGRDGGPLRAFAADAAGRRLVRRLAARERVDGVSGL